MMPSFVARVERPDRGGEWISYLERRRDAAGQWVRPSASTAARLRCSLGRADRRRRLGGRADRRLAVRGSRLSERASSTRSAPCRRTNRRRSSPIWWGSAPTAATARAAAGRPSATGSRSSRITGARDLQRHRMLTCQWQRLSPDLGAGVPDEVREAGAGGNTSAPSKSRGQSTSAWPPPGCPTRRRTRSASATGSATCST